MRILAIAIVMILSTASSVHAAVSSPKDVANDFYQWTIKYGAGGLPSEEKLKSGHGLFSKELEDLLHASLIAEKRCVKNAPPDIKPPLFEGSIFVSNYEGLSKVVALEARHSGKDVVIAAKLAYINPGSQCSRPYRWTDNLILSLENGNWVVKDIAAPGKKPWLLHELKNYVSKEVCGM